MQTKLCPKCSEPVTGRKKYCCNSCKYWFNLIRKENEKHLPPVKKRTTNYFTMIIGKHQMRVKGQGRRSGGMVKGSMSCAMYIFCPTEIFAEATPENLHKHFFGNSFPVYSARLGDGTIITLDQYKNKLQISAK